MKRALIVIDMLVDFVDGSLANKHAKNIVGPIAALANKVKTEGGIVIFANDAHLPGDPEERVWGQHALAGTAGAAVIPGLAELADYQVGKRFYSAFYETGLDALLRQNQATEVILAGQHTHICVRHTAGDAFNRGYAIAVAANTVAVFDQGTAAMTSSLQKSALEYLKNVYGATIVNDYQEL